MTTDWENRTVDCPKRQPADFVAEITFLATANGGRQGPVRSDYRPDHDFGLRGEINGASHDYANGFAWVHPGETVQAALKLLAPQMQRGRLCEGMIFTVQEGSHVVAHGKILHVTNVDLKRPAGRLAQMLVHIRSNLPARLRLWIG